MTSSLLTIRKMARVSHVWTLCFLFSFMETCLCADILLEKGSKATIACGFRKYELNTTWQVRTGHDFINVTSCTFGQNICVDFMPQHFHGEVRNSSDGLASYLTINNARINETDFRCISRYGIITNTLEVYARPRNPVCDPVELDYTKKNLQFRCNVTNVFPSVSAIISIRGVDLSQEILSGHCSNGESGSLAMDGYSAECVWRLSTAKLEPIMYKYYVKVFPDLSNSTGIIVPNAVSRDYTLQLSSPTAAIDLTQCPVGPGVVGDTIINGTTATCKCVLESPGFPVGQARWYTEQGIRSLSRDDTTDGSSTLLIYPNATGQSFECRAESPLNNPHNRGPVYTPVFASRPSDPVCDPVEIDYTKKELQFTCRARGVYSSVKAILYIKRVDWLQKGVLSNHCSYEEHRSLNLDSHWAECIWRVSAAKLEPIKYTYYVKMFPTLPNNTGINIPYVVSQDYTLQLTPSSDPETYSLKIEIVAGILGGSVGLTVIITVVIWKWRSRKRQNADTTRVIYSRPSVETQSDSGQSYQCRAESSLNSPLNWGPVYTPVFTTPSSGRETYSLRMEIVAGILAGSVALTVIIAVVISKWRRRKRQNDNTTRVFYRRPSVETQSDTESRRLDFCGSTNYLIGDDLKGQ